MSRTSFATQEQFSKISSQKLSVSKISVPNTTIVNRAQINDLANDLGSRFGIDRIPTQRIFNIQNESGPTGQPVYGVVGDVYDQIRFVGGWYSTADAAGSRVLSALNTTDYLEITFYGTGLNLLLILNAATHNFVASVDGGTESGNLATASYSGVLVSRGYNPNTVLSVVSGLSLGLHTIKIRNNTVSKDINLFGFEILNESSTMNIRPGSLLKDGSKLNLASASSQSYNSGFESGTLGTRGGRVVTYIKSDGTVGKVVNPANASAAYLGSADHSNEEVSRRINWREFGANRADDFSTLAATSSARAFTLDDGTTTLVGSDVYSNAEILSNNAISSFFTITFVGTGIDFVGIPDPALTSIGPVTIDGVSVGNFVRTAGGIVKGASGLPYGTHTVKITRSGASSVLTDFIIYQPKKPTIPAGAVEISEYNVMGDFSTSSLPDNGYIGSGLLRKMLSVREATYVGTWEAPVISVGTLASGFHCRTVTASSYVEYKFFGTGLEWRSVVQAQTNNATISVDGSSNFTVSNGSFWTGALTTSFTQVGSGATWSNTTGVLGGLNGNGSAAINIQISGLNLGWHTVRMTQNSTGGMFAGAIDVITPIHFPKTNESSFQNTLLVGSCAIGDLRESLAEESDKAKVKIAVGVASSPTSTLSAYSPAPDMSTTYYSEGEWVEISFNAIAQHGSAGGSVYFWTYVDGIPVGHRVGFNEPQVSYDFPIMTTNTVYLSPGFHKIDIYWSVPAGLGTLSGVNRSMTVKKLGK